MAPHSHPPLSPLPQVLPVALTVVLMVALLVLLPVALPVVLLVLLPVLLPVALPVVLLVLLPVPLPVALPVVLPPPSLLALMASAPVPPPAPVLPLANKHGNPAFCLVTVIRGRERRGVGGGVISLAVSRGGRSRRGCLHPQRGPQCIHLQGHGVDVGGAKDGVDMDSRPQAELQWAAPGSCHPLQDTTATGLPAHPAPPQDPPAAPRTTQLQPSGPRCGAGLQRLRP